MDDFLEKYLKETNTVLLTKDAFEYLKKRASAIDKIRAEIRKKMTFNSFNEGYVLYDDIIEVLDKYKAEKE